MILTITLGLSFGLFLAWGIWHRVTTCPTCASTGVYFEPVTCGERFCTCQEGRAARFAWDATIEQVDAREVSV